MMGHGLDLLSFGRFYSKVILLGTHGGFKPP